MEYHIWNTYLDNLGIENFNHLEPDFYSGFFYESDEGHFEFPPGCTKVSFIIKQLSADP